MSSSSSSKSSNTSSSKSSDTSNSQSESNDDSKQNSKGVSTQHHWDESSSRTGTLEHNKFGKTDVPLSLKEPIKTVHFTEEEKSRIETYDPDKRMMIEETKWIYNPKMPELKEAIVLEKMDEEIYNKTKQIKDTLDSTDEYKLDLDVFEEDLSNIRYLSGHTSDSEHLYYAYYGWIDEREYSKSKNIILHGPGWLFKSNGELREGIFQRGQLTGYGRVIYSNEGWYIGTFKNDQYHGKGTCKRGRTLRKMPVTK